MSSIGRPIAAAGKVPDIKMTSSNIPTLDVRIERWPIEGNFTISRGAKTEAVVVVAADCEVAFDRPMFDSRLKRWHFAGSHFNI